MAEYQVMQPQYDIQLSAAQLSVLGSCIHLVRESMRSDFWRVEAAPIWLNLDVDYKSFRALIPGSAPISLTHYVFGELQLLRRTFRHFDLAMPTA